jgi:hypothetical protein
MEGYKQLNMLYLLADIFLPCRYGRFQQGNLSRVSPCLVYYYSAMIFDSQSPASLCYYNCPYLNASWPLINSKQSFTSKLPGIILSIMAKPQEPSLQITTPLPENDLISPSAESDKLKVVSDTKPQEVGTGVLDETESPDEFVHGIRLWALCFSFMLAILVVGLDGSIISMSTSYTSRQPPTDDEQVLQFHALQLNLRPSTTLVGTAVRT